MRRSGPSSAVGLFLLPQLVGALSTSALRAERRKRRPRTRLSISTCAPTRSQIHREVLTDIRPKHHRHRERRAPKGESFQEDQVNEGGDVNGQRALLPSLLIKPRRAKLGLFAFPSCAVCVSSNCRMGCLRSTERTSLFTGCWASLRRWCRFITSRFWVSRCGRLLLRCPLLLPLLLPLSDVFHYHPVISGQFICVVEPLADPSYYFKVL